MTESITLPKWIPGVNRIRDYHRQKGNENACLFFFLVNQGEMSMTAHESRHTHTRTHTHTLKFKTHCSPSGPKVGIGNNKQHEVHLDWDSKFTTRSLCCVMGQEPYLETPGAPCGPLQPYHPPYRPATLPSITGHHAFTQWMDWSASSFYLGASTLYTQTAITPIDHLPVISMSR